MGLRYQDFPHARLSGRVLEVAGWGVLSLDTGVVRKAAGPGDQLNRRERAAGFLLK